MARVRRRWRNVIGISGARVAARDARAEVLCRCGRLVVLGVWDAVEKCECGRWYSLVCVVKSDESDAAEDSRVGDEAPQERSSWNDYWGGGNGDE